jgi:uncharacterized protein (DUF427 family)
MSNIEIRKASGTWVVRAGGAVLGESANVLELVEDGHDPVIYFPRGDIAMVMLDASDTRTNCPHKGEASYYAIHTKSTVIKDAAWSYETPVEAVAGIAGHLAFRVSEQVAVERV